MKPFSGQSPKNKEEAPMDKLHRFLTDIRTIVAGSILLGLLLIRLAG